jgi:2-(1,2-epoxy-1,2-dihydrophenyl)acetyl-CoA isomerase
MELENVLYAKTDGIAKITLNRPKAFNSLNPGLGRDLVRALEIAQEDTEVRVVLLTGSGKSFCTGGDLKYFTEFLETHPTEPFRQIIKDLNIAVMLIRRMPKPVIAVINGVAGGAGVSLAASCDLRICASSVKFRQAYTSIALAGDGGWSLFIPLLDGMGKAMELTLLDPVFDAKEALEWGLVTKVVDDAELENESMKIAAQLAKGATYAYALAKENINRSVLGLLESQIELERTGMINASRSEDYPEGIKAFLEKKKPNFQGK